jgi:hypothetical protein
MFTSYFAKSGLNPNAVAITATLPPWYKGKYYHLLAPPWQLVDDLKNFNIDKNQYTELYKELILDMLEPQRVLRDLGENAVLLCYEKPGRFCHRHIVSEWLRNAGIPCKEIIFE